MIILIFSIQWEGPTYLFVGFRISSNSEKFAALKVYNGEINL